MFWTRSNRGSTLLLVLAMLSILFLIGAALSFSTRLEGQASANYAELTQARMSAATGLPTAIPLVAAAANGLTNTLQPWYLAPSQWNKTAQAGRAAATNSGANAGHSRTLRNEGINPQLLPSGAMKDAPQAIFSISDLSSRVNINSIRKEESLAKLIDSVLPSSAGDAKSKARELFRLRGGDKVSTSAARLDLRRTNDNGTLRLNSLASLSRKTGKNIAPLFTEEELRTLSNYLTVFSESPEVYNLDDGTSLPKITLENISAQAVYDALKKAFPEKDQALQMQFAANVADFADSDHSPTLMNQSAQATQPWRTVFGSEQTPLITEVYPDATSPVTEGDHGQFVEISNPWNKTILMTGWRLSINGAPAATLNQSLPPGGTLILTDNYDQPDERARPGTGSFLSIFGARKDEGLRKLQVLANLNLPDRDSYIALYDDSGQLIDAFAYGSPGQLDTRVSLQREDPRLRVSKSAEATPFEPGSSSGGSQMEQVRASWKNGNQPLHSAADLFQVSTAYVGDTTGPANLVPSLTGGHPWQFAGLNALTSINERTNFDLRLVDLFTNLLPQPVEQANAAAAQEQKNRNGGRTSQNANRTAANTRHLTQQRRTTSGSTSPASPAPDASLSSSLAFAYGKLNLNTCAKVALTGLDLKLGGATWPTPDALEKFEAYRLRRVQEKKSPFVNVSDFVVEFFPQLSTNDLPALAELLDQVTVGSSSFEIAAQNRLSPEESNTQRDNAGSTPDRLTRRPAIAKARWVISTDQQPYSLVQFTTVP